MLVVAWLILIAGVAPPDDAIGDVPVTDVTVPTDTEPPRLIGEPLIVIEELVNAALPILLKVLVVPEIDLLVSVSVVSLPTNVVVASGKVTTLPAVDTASSKVIALAALLELLKRIPLLKSVPSLIVTNPVPFGWMCIPVLVLDPSAYRCIGAPTPIPFLTTK